MLKSMLKTDRVIIVLNVRREFESSTLADTYHHIQESVEKLEKVAVQIISLSIVDTTEEELRHATDV